MNIIVLDGYTANPGDLCWTGFEKLGDITVYERTESSKTAERIGDAEVILTNKTVVSGEIMKQCPNLKYIGVLATGYNVVDIAEAKRRGIIVTNIPSYGTDAVAQYTIALLLELCHHIGEHSDCVKAGEWSRSVDWCFWNHPLIELRGKTMGIIGFGNIGQRTASIAKALGMNILAYDKVEKSELVNAKCKYTSLNELFAESDVICLHCLLSEETKGIINKDTIAKMKTGVMIINDSRGPLIVEEDLRDALNSGKIGGAAVDVVSTEPIQMDNPLLDAKNIIITPHIAWAPKEARQRLMDIAVENLKAFMNGRPQNAVM